MKVLIIEDEADLRQIIGESLLRENFVVEYARDFNAALEKSTSYDYDCILLDIGLPGGSGLDILRTLKKENKMSNVIIISAKDSLDDKLEGLDLGADDYLPKPFHVAELNARIRSVLRRKNFDGGNTASLGNLTINFLDRTVSVEKYDLVLNRKEFDTLAYFMMNKNRLVNKSSLAEHVWGDYIDRVDDFEFIYSQIKNLRKKLKDSNASVEILAVYGVGYKMTEA